MAGGTIKNDGWILAGSEYGQIAQTNPKITYPSAAKELLISVIIDTTDNPTYTGVFLVSNIQNSENLFLGGYYNASNDTAVANVNHDAANRQIWFRNAKMGTVNKGTVYVYYKT